MPRTGFCTKELECNRHAAFPKVIGNARGAEGSGDYYFADTQRSLLGFGDWARQASKIGDSGLNLIKALQGVPILVLLLVATTLEVSGDAIVRMAIHNHVGRIRIGLFLAGAALLLGYGSFLNLAPLDFGRVVGLYIATLFVVWQVINAVVFRSFPTMPILVGGTLVIAGGAIISLWKPA